MWTVFLSGLLWGQTVPVQQPIDVLIAKVQAAVKTANQQTDRSVAALEAQYATLEAQALNDLLSSGKKGGVEAELQLKQLRMDVDARECAVHAQKAGIKGELLNAQYLMEWGSPIPMIYLPCQAARMGVSFRYEPKGWFSKERFEVKGARSIRVMLARETLLDKKTINLVPIEARVNGDTFEVTRTNLRILAFHIRSAFNNE